MQQLAQDPHALQLVVSRQQLFAAGAGTVDVDGREDTLFSNLAVQGQLHVTGTLELFVDHFIHLRAGFNQRGSDDGQRAAFFDVTRSTEETLWLLKSVCIDTTGQHLAGARDDGVVSTCQTGNGVKQNDHILFVLDQALGFFDDHFGHLHVAGRWFVERRRDHFAAHGALHLGHFLWTLIDQQHDQMHFRVVARDVGGDVLQHDGLARFWRSDDQATLALADRGAQVDDTAGEVFGGTVAGFHLHAHGREQRREVLEQDLVLRVFWTVEVDRVDLQQGEIPLTFFWRADLADDGVTGTQVEATNLAGRDVDIVGASEVGSVSRTQETEAVLEDLQHAITGDFLAAFGMFFQQGENHILLARTGHIFYAHLFGHFEQIGNRLLLEFSQVHKGMT